MWELLQGGLSGAAAAAGGLLGGLGGGGAARNYDGQWPDDVWAKRHGRGRGNDVSYHPLSAITPGWSGSNVWASPVQ